MRRLNKQAAAYSLPGAAGLGARLELDQALNMLDTIGATLRAAREARGWTIEEVEKVTRIRGKYLSALEAGEMDALPSPLQARGFLRNYAQHLGLQPEQVLNQLEEALKPQRRGFLPTLTARGKTSPAARATAPSPSTAAAGAAARANSPVASVRRLRRVFTPDLIIAVVAIVVVIGFLVWGGSQLVNRVLNPPLITLTAEVLGPTYTPSPTIIAGVTPSATPLPPGISFTNVQLTLVIERRTFVRVTTDGGLAFEGILLPDARKEFTARSVAEVTTGDAASIRIILNQRDLGLMGSPGEVLTRQFTASGMVTVTATITLTPSETLTPTESPMPSETPAETPVPGATRTSRP